MSRELLQQALNALENGKRVRAFEGGTKYQPDLEDSAIAAIRAHLAQPAPAEPVIPLGAIRPMAVEAIRAVTGCPDIKGNGRYLVDEMEDVARAAVLAAQPAPAEPVAWAMRRPDGLVLDVITPEEHEHHAGKYTIPLYSTQPAPVPVPLTDEQIDAMWREPMSADWEHREFARAIEAHHGIVASPEKKL
jgi:hypothetical protein